MRGDPRLTNGQVARIEDWWRGKHEEVRDVDDGIDVLAGAVDFENTYVFFTSDNGWIFGEHRQTHKASPYEDSSRTPLLVRGPDVRPGASSAALATTVEVTATVYELAGIDPEPLDGRSLLAPMVSDEPFEWRDRLLITQPEDEVGASDVPGWNAVRTAGRTYVEYGTGEPEPRRRGRGGGRPGPGRPVAVNNHPGRRPPEEREVDEKGRHDQQNDF